MTNFISRNLIFASLMGLLLLCLSGISEAQNNHDCCLSYSTVRLPRWAINGYTEQLSTEVCDIDAIIFHTKNGRSACANPEERWVKKHLLWLSQKLRKMSL
ncbi:C-C motif chemokine 20-like [Pelodiscus sinensis]|uniref:C-C motif chemokine n=1 Tax=Pelodiscus sinensis TaxID=13735 RepID=K7FB05_PELSI|nr:C-C motif chemokine 20-like [Pelodiscus sinensis]|eukprot:XP_006119948.1 C-C motif chemokine 20-like [Pelodiscus sinensis]